MNSRANGSVNVHINGYFQFTWRRAVMEKTPQDFTNKSGD